MKFNNKITVTLLIQLLWTHLL